MSNKKLIKRGLISLAKILPSNMWWRMFRLWMHVIAGQSPKKAMRILLEIDDVLTRNIDRTAIRYDDGVHVKHRLMHYHDFFVERLRAGERVLDIGCGYGAVAFSMASRAHAQVVGVDLNAQNIASARARFQHPNLTFIHGDASTDLPAESFETIVISNVLEHIEHRVEFLRQAQIQIQPRRWLIRVPMINRDWEVFMRQELGMYYYSDPTHCTEYTRQSFAEEMAQAGLTITHLQINWGEIWAEATRQS
jgi:2-polyprenyl-3-methyl-5-hydroxy-6-metoxy-1,4-benzoquinol methylase